MTTGVTGDQICDTICLMHTFCTEKVLGGILAILIGYGTPVNSTISFGHLYDGQAQLSFISCTKKQNIRNSKFPKSVFSQLKNIT